VPAAAVIPAPIAYIKVVAVKKLVVGHKTRPLVDRTGCTGVAASHHRGFDQLRLIREPSFTVKKLECSKQAAFA
jgi:hypothetical protein